MRRFMSTFATGAAVGAILLAAPAATHATLSAGPPLQNPFIARNSTTGAQAQIMPTTGYLAKYGLPTGSSTSPCVLGTDNSPGDAHVLVNNFSTQFDSLDLTSLGLSSTSSSITGRITVENLHDGSPAGTPAVPAVAGGGDIWYIVWNYGNNPSIKGYFLEAEYPGSPADTGYTNSAATGNLPVDFTYGTIGTSATGGEQFTTAGAAGGSFNPVGNSVTITSPLSTVGSPPAGAALSAPYVTTDALVGSSVTGGLLETADKITSSVGNYKVGQFGTNCPTAASGPTAGAYPTAGSTTNLAYFGGPVVHAVKNYIIWWLPKAGTLTYSNGASCTIPGTLSYSYEQPASSTAPVPVLPGGPDGDTDYQAIIKQYFSDLGGSAFYNLLTQYADEESGATRNSESLAGTWTDNCGYTSTPSPGTTVPGGTDAAPIYQLDIQNEVERAIQINHWPDGLGNEYFVYTGYGAADCFAPATSSLGSTPTCDVAGPVPAYCAYHGDFQDTSGNYVLYADMDDGAFAANPSSVNLCYSAPIGVSDPTHTVNGKQVTDAIADAEVSISSHEEFETVNDAEVGTASQYAPPLGWYDEANGEIGDKCAYYYGNYASDGSNVDLHGDHYIVQQEYSNWNNGCGLTPYERNGGFGGASTAVPISKGWTVIGVPVSGITDSAQLVSNMEAAGSLPSGSITEVETFHNGKYQVYVVGQSTPIPLARTDGVLVYSKVAGTWHPTGSLYTTPATVTLSAGWNLVAATWPNPGLTTDSIFNQIEAETGACTAAVLTNAACSPTITEIKTYGAGGALIDWKPAPNSNGNATWPQTYGNQIPFTSGMWVYATKAITWTVQGNECQTVDSSGTCH